MSNILGMKPGNPENHIQQGRHVAATKGIGDAIRSARVQRGLSQATLAKSIGVSRSTLNHIEHFDVSSPDVGVLKIIAAAQQVGVALSVLKEPAVLLERRLERERASAKASAVREKHYRLAAALALADDAAVSSLVRAREMVQVWRKNQSCSEEYIDRWSRIVSHGPKKAAKGMLSIPHDWVNAMFQNTPFSGAEQAA